ncbi:unnamed protein product [Bursaphelenchus xylophilus]|uniref:(pine wood nematode) hypothetical protein n=1 Tax=Bursaphelenchus xylophilus TaxID=6326 RepID=A0A1I7SC86_BURXY|nr:unnamed protein product [Bursaphelenchus xylophilus]CAG9094561.1 unnamed protein product [Bursaphelenchus xylophilus]
MIPSDVCEESSRFSNNVALRFTELLTAGISMYGLYLLLRITKRPSCFAVHKNFQILLYNIGISIFIEFSTGVVSNLFAFFRSFIYTGHCENVYTVWLSVLLKWPLIWMVSTMSLFHVAMLLERVFASFCKESYERMGCSTGVVLCAAVWILTFLLNYDHNLSTTYKMIMPYCITMTPQNAERMFYLWLFLLPVELITTAGDFLLRHVNNTGRSEIIVGQYSLGRSYQMQENYLTGKLVFPVTMVHSTFYTIYLLLSILARILQLRVQDRVNVIIMIIYIHNVMQLTIVMSMARYIKKVDEFEGRSEIREIRMKREESTEIYFDYLHKQMDGRFWGFPKKNVVMPV